MRDQLINKATNLEIVMHHANLEKALVIRILRDPSFKQKLLKHPKESIREFCKDNPETRNIDLNQIQVRVEQEKKNEWVLVIPYLEENSTLSDRDLERLAAGVGITHHPKSLYIEECIHSTGN